MKVKLKEKNYTYDLPKGYEFTVTSHDDGEYSLHAFYQGWVKDSTGHKMLASFDKKECEVTDWEGWA